jgi:hypothetical protein
VTKIQIFEFVRKLDIPRSIQAANADPKLTPAERQVYIAIILLSFMRGFCFAGNSYLSNRLPLPTASIRVRITYLKQKGYIQVNYDGQERQIIPLKLCWRKEDLTAGQISKLLNKQVPFEVGFHTDGDVEYGVYGDYTVTTR